MSGTGQRSLYAKVWFGCCGAERKSTLGFKYFYVVIILVVALLCIVVMKLGSSLQGCVWE